MRLFGETSTKQLLDKIQAIESRADELTSGLEDQSFSWSPEPGRWSVGECLDEKEGNLTFFQGFP